VRMTSIDRVVAVRGRSTVMELPKFAASATRDLSLLQKNAW